jgi:D-serine deaminase-like pyridoxal phosphate-dependent protein
LALGAFCESGLDQEASRRFSRQSLHSPDTSTENLASGVYTEVQCGAYIFMDADYGRNRDRDGEPTKAFEPSLFVWATVMSRPTGDRAIVG